MANFLSKLVPAGLQGGLRILGNSDLASFFIVRAEQHKFS